MLAAETLGSALHLIRTDKHLSIGNGKRYAAAGTPCATSSFRATAAAPPSFFDACCAGRLAELLSAEIVPDLTEMDLIPLAIALAKGWAIVAGGDGASYLALDDWLRGRPARAANWSRGCGDAKTCRRWGEEVGQAAAMKAVGHGLGTIAAKPPSARAAYQQQDSGQSMDLLHPRWPRGDKALLAGEP